MADSGTRVGAGVSDHLMVRQRMTYTHVVQSDRALSMGGLSHVYICIHVHLIIFSL